MKLVVWLGNPGKKYEKTRHNIWFVFLDLFLKYKNLGKTKYVSKFGAEFFKTIIAGEQILFVKPMTFMNQSGGPIQSIVNFYKIDVSDILVLHDEIDLELSKIKTKMGGGHAWHNGLRDLIARLWSRDFERLRIGVGRPKSKDEVTDYVLWNFGKQEISELEAQSMEVFGRIEEFLKGEGTSIESV